MYNDRGYEKPVKEGDVVEVTIEGTGAKGDGIARINGFVIVVPGGKEGSTVKVKITRVLRKMAFAELAGEGEEASEESMDDEESMDEEESMDDEDSMDDESSDDEESMDDEED